MVPQSVAIKRWPVWACCSAFASENRHLVDMSVEFFFLHLMTEINIFLSVRFCEPRILLHFLRVLRGPLLRGAR